MLKNLTPNKAELKRRKAIAKKNNFTWTAQYDKSLILETGIYICNCDFNFSHEEFEEYKGLLNIPLKDEYEMFSPTYHKAQYGVADSVEQIKNYFREEVEDPDKAYFIAVTPVFQDPGRKGKGGGWRWHKWGEYIGELDIKCEYLDDEDFGKDFDCVLTFHIYPINPQ